jgi:hypothetical protein
MYNWYHDIRCIWHENNCHWDTAFRVRLPSKDTFWCRDCGRVLCDSHRYQHTCERLDALKERNDSWLQQLGRQCRVLNTKSPARSGWSVLLMTHNVVYLLEGPSFFNLASLFLTLPLFLTLKTLFSNLAPLFCELATSFFYPCTSFF